MDEETEILIKESDRKTAGLMPLSELLKNRFTIPVYQRPYAWRNENFEDLLTTIRDSKEQNLPAFFGSIIVAEKVEERPTIGSRCYLLIDGQQRITSFLILLKLVRQKLLDLGNALQEKEKTAKDTELREVIKKSIRISEIKKIIEEMLKSSKRLEREISNGRNYSNSDKAFENESDILSYIFKNKKISEIDNKDIKGVPSIFDDEVKNIGDDDDFVDYISYILDSSQFCFLVVQGKLSEDYAIDIFNTFNSTGEPLTAFEIMKPSIIKKDREMEKQLNMIEKSISSMKRTKQGKYTDRLLFFLSMMYSELNTDKFSNIRDKKFLIDKIVKKQKKNIAEYVKSICSLHEFIFKNWESGKSINPFSIGSEVYVCFKFLKDIKHDRTIPILFKFSDSKERGEAAKACAAFTCLWRGVVDGAGTGSVDKQYEIAIKRLFEEDHDIEGLKSIFRKCLANKWESNNVRHIDIRKEWIKTFAGIDVYKRKNIAKFILFVSFHKSEFDSENSTFSRSKKKFLTIDNYKEYDSVEHIVPQDYSVVNKIGNLILLPQQINSKAGKKDFVSKRKIYKQCLVSKDVGDGMPYLEILREVVSYDGDSYLDENLHLNDAAIKERGERLGHAVWETLAEDWLGWTGG